MIWIKPNGSRIEINDDPETVEYVESLGWQKAEQAPIAAQSEPNSWLIRFLRWVSS